MKYRVRGFMGFLFLPYSAHGHVLPMLVIAAELVRRGESVRVIVGSEYHAAVRAAGAAAVSAPVEHRVRVPAGWSPGEMCERMRLWRGRRTAWHALAGLVGRELRGDPTQVCVVDMHIPWAQTFAQRCGARTVPFWTTHGRVSQGGPGLMNVMPEFVSGGALPATGIHLVGPLVRADLFGEPANRGPRPGPRVLVVSPGTVFARSADYFRAIAWQFAGAEWTVVLTTAGLPVAKLGELPANALAYEWIPQHEILRTADVFITHGGINSVHEAVLAGVPMVSAPRCREQRRTTVRLCSLGIGERWRGVGQVRAQVERLASDPSVAENLAALRARAGRAFGVQRAADILMDTRAGAGRTLPRRTPGRPLRSWRVTEDRSFV